MNVSLTTELEQLVNDKVKTGMYQTASEVIREGLRLLNERDRQLEALRRDIRVGFDAADRGDYKDYDANSIKALAGEVKARGRKRLAREARKSKAR